ITEQGVVPSPPARFLQWRARFGGGEKGETAQVKKVEIVYQRVNQAPNIESVEIGGSGGGGTSTPSKSSSNGGSSSGSSGSSSAASNSSTTPASPGAAASVQIEWKASDANGDDLVYVLSYRQ